MTTKTKVRGHKREYIGWKAKGEDKKSTRTGYQYYTRNAWEGKEYNKREHLSGTEITKRIRQQLKQEFPDSKFSVTRNSYSGGQSINVSLMSSKTKILKKPNEISEFAIQRTESIHRYNKQQILEMQQKGYHQLNQYTLLESYNEDKWNNGVFLTKEGHNMLQDVVKIVQQYNYDDSDSMIDYFSTNFYLHLEIGKWDRPFIQE